MALAPLSPSEVAYLAGGPWRSAQTGMAMLYARGALVADRPQQVSRTGSVPPDAGPVERALYASLYGFMGPRELAAKPRVGRAIAEVRAGLVRRGLLRPAWRRLGIPALLVVAPPVVVARWVDLSTGGTVVALSGFVVAAAAAIALTARPTFAGLRLLRRLRRQHRGMLPTGRPPGDVDRGPDDKNPDPERMGTAVALFGTAGLLTAAPRFAARSGLVDGGRWSTYLGDGPLQVSTNENG